MSGRESEWSCVPLGYATGVWRRRCVAVCDERQRRARQRRAREGLLFLFPHRATHPKPALHQQQPITHRKPAPHLSSHIINNPLHIASQLPSYQATSSTTHYTSQASSPSIELHHQQPITHLKQALQLSSYYINNSLHIPRRLHPSSYYINNNLLHIASQIPSYQATTSTTHYASHAGSPSTTIYYTSQAA